MNENISFRKLRIMIKTRGFSVAEFAAKCGEMPTAISAIIGQRRIPKTDLLARMCSILECYPSEIVTFKGIEINSSEYYYRQIYTLPDKSSGEVTYKPFWLFLIDYLDEHKGLTEKDILDQIEPPRRLNGKSNIENIKKAVAARFGEGYVSKRTNRTDYSKGLTQVTRTKLRNDRPVNLAVIYEICKHFGCSIDFVLGYK